MRKSLLILGLVFLSGFTFSGEFNGGVFSGYGGYGYRNPATYNLAVGLSQPLDFQLDMVIRGGYSSGTTRLDNFNYRVINACLGIDAYSLFGSRSPYIGFGAGYYKITDLWLNEGVLKRLGGYFILGALGQVGGVKSPLCIDLRWENHFVPNIPNTYLTYVKGASALYSSAKDAKEIRFAYSSKTMIYSVLSFGIKCNFL